MDFGPALDALAAGGDVAVIGFAWALWRLDRRLVIIETALKAHLAGGKED